MDLPEFSTGYWPLLLIVLFFVIIAGRYFLFSGIFYFIFYSKDSNKWADRKVNKANFKEGQLRKEMKYSTINAFIFAIVAMLTVLLWQKGIMKVYVNIDEYPLWYLPASLVIYLFLQETYYYWIHRWMHFPKVFKIVHLVHHQSKISSPFTAFSFHPIEGLLQAIILPVLFLFVPIHLYVLIIILTIMSITSVINHLGIEIYPKKSYSWFAKWVIGASHHSLHHTRTTYNYGLFFTIWDRWLHTESEGFEEVFKGEKKTGFVKSISQP